MNSNATALPPPPPYSNTAGGRGAAAHVQQAAQAELAALEIVPFDAHCHVGLDTDGSALSFAQLQRQLGSITARGALITPLHQAAGYATVNSELAAASERNGGSVALHHLWRINPLHEPSAPVVTKVREGALGIKLHPASDAFSVAAAETQALLRELNGTHAIVLVHTGVDATDATRDVITSARTYPELTFIAAHAGADALDTVARAACELPNLLVDTAWWMALDLADLLRRLPARNIVFGSDPPYGEPALAAFNVARIARHHALSPAAVQAIFHGNLEAAMERRTTYVTSRVPATAALAQPPEQDGVVSVAAARVFAHLLTANAALEHHRDATLSLRQALATLGDMSLEANATIRSALQLAQQHENQRDAQQLTLLAATQALFPQPA